MITFNSSILLSGFLSTSCFSSFKLQSQQPLSQLPPLSCDDSTSHPLLQTNLYVVAGILAVVAATQRLLISPLTHLNLMQQPFVSHQLTAHEFQQCGSHVFSQTVIAMSSAIRNTTQQLPLPSLTQPNTLLPLLTQQFPFTLSISRS